MILRGSRDIVEPEFFNLAIGGMDSYEHMLCFFTQGIRFWGQKF